MAASFSASFEDAAQALDMFRSDANTLDTLNRLSKLVFEAFSSGGKVLVCGNGGSLADAVHFAEEWTGRFRSDRAPYPVLALAEPSHLTCVANDYGFEHVFERGVRAFGKSGDVLIMLSTSGRSPNLLLAAKAGQELGMTTVGFLGRDGGELKALCELSVIAPGETSDRIQELHMLALHSLIEVTEEMLSA